MIYVYMDSKGCPFSDWMAMAKKKDPSAYRKMLSVLSQMEDGTLPMVRPNVKKTPSQRTGHHHLYKLRLGKYRLFFEWRDHDYYLLHLFRKSSNATPDKEFRVVKKEMEKQQYEKLNNLKEYEEWQSSLI